MVVTTSAGLIKKGLESEKPNWVLYLEDFLYYAYDTGNLYYYSSSSRSLLQGAEKAEILKNKQISLTDNTITGLIQDPFVSSKRIGFLTPASTAENSLNLALKGLPFVGNYTLVRDPVEGYVSRCDNLVIGNIGYISDAAVNFVTRRAYNPRLKCRVKLPTPTTHNLIVGFSSALPHPTGSTYLDVNTAGAVWVMSTGTSFLLLRHGTGEGGVVTTFTTTITKPTDYATYEIVMSSSDIKFYYNNVLIRTATTNLPTLDRDIYLTIHIQGGSKEFFIPKIYFSDDITGV